MCRGLGLLIVTMLLAQLVVNMAVINVKLLSPGDPAVVGALLAAMVLARVPLFVFASLQASLLPGLAGAIAAGDTGRFRRLVVRGVRDRHRPRPRRRDGRGDFRALAGPGAVRRPSRARSYADFALLAAGTLFYMLAMVLGPGRDGPVAPP